MAHLSIYAGRSLIEEESEYIKGLNWLIIFFLLMFYVFEKTKNEKTEEFQIFTLNNQNFKVKKNLPNHEKAYYIIKFIDKQILHFIELMKNKYDINESSNEKDLNNEIKVCINRLCKKYKSSNLKENFPKNSKESTSYTIRKGEIVAICLRSIQDKSFHDLNDIFFVVIHELAHISTKEYGHGVIFWKNFKLLLREAVLFNLYKFVDYSKYPVNYCGMNITYSPLSDPEL
jgi:hypothetical protein